MQLSLLDSYGPAYRSLRDYAARRSPTGLLSELPEPRAGRYAATLGDPVRPRSVAVFSSFDEGQLQQSARRALELCLVDDAGELYDGPLGSLAKGPFLHLELVESFDRRRGHARALLEGLASDNDLLLSPLESSVDLYGRLGFERLPIFDSVGTRPLLYRDTGDRPRKGNG